MTDEIMNLRALMEKTPRGRSVARDDRLEPAPEICTGR
jgi:hypothetical protein